MKKKVAAGGIKENDPYSTQNQPLFIICCTHNTDKGPNDVNLNILHIILS